MGGGSKVGRDGYKEAYTNYVITFGGSKRLDGAIK